MRQPFPILEFDPAREGVIEPGKTIRPRDVPAHVVLCFFREVVEKVHRDRQARIAHRIRWEDGAHILYETEWEGHRLGFMQPGVGAPVAVGLMEELIALGCRHFVACGGAGALASNLPVGTVILPVAAVRDEGTSYHYLPPAREVEDDPKVRAVLQATLDQRGIPYLTGKTWTTDAPYRETRKKVLLRREEGCLTVEMETAAFYALARFRGVDFGQFLYAGDDLSGDEWDSRGWARQRPIREQLFDLAATACLQLVTETVTV